MKSILYFKKSKIDFINIIKLLITNMLPTDIENMIMDYVVQLNKSNVNEEIKNVCLECRKKHDKKTHQCEECHLSYCNTKEVISFFCPPYYAGNCPHCETFNFIVHEKHTYEDYNIPSRN